MSTSLTNKDFTALLVRLMLGYIFLSAGLCKLSHGYFGQLIGPSDLIEQLAEYDLEIFGYFIAVSQVVIGGLCMSQRFSLLGLIGLVPMNISILTFTTSQGWTGTPFINGFLLMLNILALLYEWPYLKGMLGGSNIEVPPSIRLFNDWKLPVIGIICLLLAVLVADGSPQLANLMGSVFFIILWGGMMRQAAFSKLELGVLALFLLAILNMTYMAPLNELRINPILILLLCIALGLLLFIVGLWRKRRVSP